MLVVRLLLSMMECNCIYGAASRWLFFQTGTAQWYVKDSLGLVNQLTGSHIRCIVVEHTISLDIATECMSTHSLLSNIFGITRGG